MTDELVLTARVGAVATVTVNRPAVLNALNVETVATLTAVLSGLGDDDDVRCVVLTGAGDRAFIAGADITEMANLTPVDAKTMAEAGHRLCALIESLGKPVIASVNGFALGGGCEVAMACTLRIAADNAKFGQPEIGLGLIPGFGGTQRLPRLVGRGRGLELLLTGRPIAADEAWRIGLVNRVVSAEALGEEVGKLAATLAGQAPAAVRLILETVRRGLDMSLDEASAFEATAFGLVNGTDDAREGTRAFVEKRTPRFVGR